MENPPVKIAFIIDGKVVDVLHTDERLAAIFLSDPVVIDVTKIYNDAAGAINMTPHPAAQTRYQPPGAATRHLKRLPCSPVRCRWRRPWPSGHWPWLRWPGAAA